MNFKKELSGVAAEVAKIMEAELSKKQKEIAKMSEPKHKIDAGDLAKLRAGHKPVKGETVTESDLPKSNSKEQKTVTVKHKTSGKELKVVDTPSVREKYKKMDYHPMSEEQEQIVELSTKTLAKAASAASDPDSSYDKAHDPQKYADHAKKYKSPKAAAAVQGAADGKGHFPRHSYHGGSDSLAQRTSTRTTSSGMANKQDIKALKSKIKQDKEYRKEEVEYFDEGIEDKIAAAREKAAAAGKPMKEPKKQVSAKRKVEGPRYGGGKQKEDMEESTSLPFTSMLEAYDANGLAAFVKNEEVEQIDENITHIVAKSDLQKHKDYMDSEGFETKTRKLPANHPKHKTHVGIVAQSNQEHSYHSEGAGSHAEDYEAPKKTNEEVVVEGDAYDKDRYAVKNGKATKDNPSHRGSPNYKDQAHHVWANSAEEALQKKMKREEVDNETYKKEMEDQKASMEGKKKQPSVATPSTQGVKNMDEEVEQVEERTLTEPETEKKEKFVKGMKKKLSGFKQRYGERAKEVMYATATRMAKED